MRYVNQKQSFIMQFVAKVLIFSKAIFKAISMNAREMKGKHLICPVLSLALSDIQLLLAGLLMGVGLR
jgi:hypothetical protein